MIHLVTFATDEMSRAVRRCIDSGFEHGIDNHARYDWGNMAHDMAFAEYRDRFHLPPFSAARGAGLWAWKPLIVKAGLDWCNDGDILIYSDAGIEFINNLRYIIDRMDQDIFLFGNNWEHAHWCKRDIVDAVWPWTSARDIDGHELTWERFGKQVQASVIFFRVSDYTRKFVKEWLDWCLFEGGRLIDDSPSRTPNHPEFRENRHDQAILTTMAYREGIKLHYWPAQYNDGAFSYEKLPEYAGDNYPTLFHHHRRRNWDWPVTDILIKEDCTTELAETWVGMRPAE